MKVIATKLAFFEGSRVRPGTELDVPDGLKGSWFVALDSVAAKAAKAKPAAKQEPKALSELPRGDGKTFVEVHEGKSALA